MSGTGKPRSKRKSMRPQRVVFGVVGEKNQRDVRFSSAQTDDGKQDFQQKECDIIGYDKSPSSSTQLRNEDQLKKHVMMGHDEGGANGDEEGDSGARCVRFEKDASAKDETDGTARDLQLLPDHADVDEDHLTCNSCDERFHDSSSLNRHRLLHSDEKTSTQKTRCNESQHQFACDICAKRFKFKSNMKVHKITHSDDRKFICSVCQKSFKTKGNLFNHQYAHSDVRPYACDVCSKRFKMNNKLTRHKKTHVDDPSYACDLCEKKFQTKRECNDHKTSHMGDRLYACDVCEMKFKSNPALLTHKAVHSDRRHNCHLCNATFKQKRYLSAHVHKIHPNVRC